MMIKRLNNDEILMPYFAVSTYYIPCWKLIETMQAVGLLDEWKTSRGSLCTAIYDIHMRKAVADG